MKKTWISIALVAVFVVSVGLCGCEKEDPVTGAIDKVNDDVKSVDTDAVKKELDAAKDVEHPAADKPKDHPAH